MSIKSFDEIRGLVESVVMQKKAHDSNTPSDPYEVATPAVSAEGVVSEKCVNVPVGKTNGTATEKQTSSAPLKSSDEPSSVSPEKKEAETVTEEAVAKKGSALLSKIQDKLASKKEEPKKEANVSNVASGIELSVDSLAKVASEILNTEEGVKFAQELFRKRAGEEYAKEAIKEASAQAIAFEQYENSIKKASESMNTEQEQFINKIASQIEALPEDQKKLAYASIQAHDANLSSYDDAEVLKCAYAAGVEDAVAIQENPEILENAEQEATEEEAGKDEITPEEVLEVVNEMVESGDLDEDTAQQLVAELAADIESAEDADEEPEAVSDEVEEPEAAKMASVIIEGTKRLKKASVEQGTIPAEEGEATIEDVVNVIQQLVEEGSISEEEAQKVLQEIAAAISENDEASATETTIKETPTKETITKETSTPQGDTDIVEEEVAKSASIINALLK